MEIDRRVHLKEARNETFRRIDRLRTEDEGLPPDPSAVRRQFPDFEIRDQPIEIDASQLRARQLPGWLPSFHLTYSPSAAGSAAGFTAGGEFHP
jgi:hypothetical protein